MKNKILKTIYSAGGFRPFHFFNRDEVLILTYHRFSREPGKVTISESEFEDHLRYLKKHTNVIALDDIVQILESGDELPKNATAITIDDGYRDSYDIAYPLLRKYEMPATLFVITDFLAGNIWLWTDLMRFVMLNTSLSEINLEFDDEISVCAKLSDTDSRIDAASLLNDQLKRITEDDKTLKINEIADYCGVALSATPPAEYGPISWTQAVEMDNNGLSIECHTVTHPIMTNISDSRLKLELEASKSVISKELDREVRHFCYPNGSFDERVVMAVKAAGFASAVTTNYGFCDSETDRFKLRRIDGQPSIAGFAQSVSGFERLRGKIGI